MSRSRFSSQEVFLSEVDRLQKQRSRLLKERNYQEFPKFADQNPYSQSGVSHRQHIDHDTRQHFSHSRRSPRTFNNTNGPNIEEVKMMLEDIMKNSQKHGMNKTLSLQYLKDIQFKLTKEIQEFNTQMRRTVESDKLRSLKVFVDKLVSFYDISNKSVRQQHDKGKEPKQDEKKALQKIPEAAYPSISSMQHSLASSNSQSNHISSSQYKSSSEIYSSEQSSDSNTNKDITLRKINTNQASGLLDLLQNKIFDEVSALRHQNERLRKQLEDLRDNRSYSKGRRRDSINQNETLINQLVTNPKNYQTQNNRLKNKIRSLEMELLSFRSLKHIDIGKGESRLHMSLEGKDNEIRYLRKQIQDLILHLQNSKQQIQFLKQQMLSKTDHQQKLIASIKSLESQLHRMKGSSSRVDVNYQNYKRNVENQQYPSESKKRVLDFKKKNFVDRENLERVFNNDIGKSLNVNNDKFGEYRQVLFTLRSLRK